MSPRRRIKGREKRRIIMFGLSVKDMVIGGVAAGALSLIVCNTVGNRKRKKDIKEIKESMKNFSGCNCDGYTEVNDESNPTEIVEVTTGGAAAGGRNKK